MRKQDKLSEGNSILYGIAFDNKDKHKRITTGENFYIVGGSADTHENLVEKVLEFNKVIKKYGKKLHDLSEAEFYDITNKISANSGKTHWLYHM